MAKAKGASSIAQWLRQVEPGGELDGYLVVLEEFCDLEELRALYVQVVDGTAKLQPSFFDDLGIQDVRHQGLFARGVAGGFVGDAVYKPAARGSPESHVSVRATMGLLGGIHENAKNVSLQLQADRLAASASAEGVPALGASFPEWLREVDPSGGLDGYLAALEENFDVEDVPKLWQEARFFEELGVSDAQHQRLFAAFFGAALGLPATAAMPSHAADPAQPRQAGAAHETRGGLRAEEASDFSGWLRNVDPTGGLDVYLAVLEEHCEFPLEQRYVESDGRRRRLNPQFFEDMGIQDQQHRQQFADYYNRAPAAA